MKTSTRRACLQVAGSSLLLSAAAPAATAPAPESEFLALFAKRQSVRRYKPDPVPDEHLRLILDAARRAPTSGNQQPWKFLVVKDRARIERLRTRCLDLAESHLGNLSPDDRAKRRETMEKALAGYFSAPVYVVVLTDSKSTYPTYNHWDGPLAAGYLMLAARALGYGTVFITDSIPEVATKEAFEIPERYQRVCITPIGVPDGWPEPKPKKKLEELVAWETL
ncbi:MAG: nitroreductase family protein [Bryobacteraceae bacterium]|jgi:nitroreductase